MSFAPAAVPDSWGLDTIYVFDQVHSKTLIGADYQGKPLKFMWRYGEDLSIAERDVHLGNGWILLLVFHVERPSWQATPENGTQHGQRMVGHATRLGYPPGCHLALDLEGLGDTGAPVLAHVRNVAAVVKAAGFKLCLYVGYADGLLLAQLAQLVAEGSVDVLWSDYGPRVAPAGVGFVCKQSAQTKVAGVILDPDRCFGADEQGRQLWGMVLGAPPANDPQDTEPHTDPAPALNVDPIDGEAA